MIQRVLTTYETDRVTGRLVKVVRRQIVADETDQWVTMKPREIIFINPDEERSILDGQRAIHERRQQDAVTAISELDLAVAAATEQDPIIGALSPK